MNKYIIPYTGSPSSIPSEDRLTRDYIATFDSSTYKTVVLLPGAELWRFYSGEPNRQLSDYWVDNDTMSAVMQLFHVSGNFKLRQKQEIIRDSLAILYEWNKLTHRIRIQIKHKIIAYSGPTGTQKVIRDIKMVKPKFGEKVKPSRISPDFRHPGAVTKSDLRERQWGGYTQYVIPRFGLLKATPHKIKGTYANITYSQAI